MFLLELIFVAQLIVCFILMVFWKLSELSIARSKTSGQQIHRKTCIEYKFVVYLYHYFSYILVLNIVLCWCMMVFFFNKQNTTTKLFFCNSNCIMYIFIIWVKTFFIFNIMFFWIYSYKKQFLQKFFLNKICLVYILKYSNYFIQLRLSYV